MLAGVREGQGMGYRHSSTPLVYSTQFHFRVVYMKSFLILLFLLLCLSFSISCDRDYTVSAPDVILDTTYVWFNFTKDSTLGDTCFYTGAWGIADSLYVMRMITDNDSLVFIKVDSFSFPHPLYSASHLSVSPTRF